MAALARRVIAVPTTIGATQAIFRSASRRVDEASGVPPSTAGITFVVLFSSDIPLKRITDRASLERLGQTPANIQSKRATNRCATDSPERTWIHEASAFPLGATARSGDTTVVTSLAVSVESAPQPVSPER